MIPMDTKVRDAKRTNASVQYQDTFNWDTVVQDSMVPSHFRCLHSGLNCYMQTCVNLNLISKATSTSPKHVTLNIPVTGTYRIPKRNEKTANYELFK